MCNFSATIDTPKTAKNNFQTGKKKQKKKKKTLSYHWSNNQKAPPQTHVIGQTNVDVWRTDYSSV